ncbi:FHS family L-fucose permease-like MFS transporter [Crenobacter luteus]|uniref:L-fucose:H+ symporter permease n=1 Tax=Crenobacter luteus TaxID=1452487 RepID=UPI001052F3A0|nr:L-fucose:H+ symporter permease [Crenobacter luteus]TCP10640.1 FHS family L-fucose permease-like MFS transporter [Crenobacter luteus]
MSKQMASQNYTQPLAVLTSLFFMWGLITSLNDILIPHMKAIFDLSFVQAALIQFSFFTAYFVMSFPSGYLVEKVGYKQGIVIGLVVAGVGCLLFYPAASVRSYPFFLAALFILASGITLLQVAANPYVTLLGQPETASSRLNLTQAFNSLGTAVGPLLGSVLILSVAIKSADEMKALSPEQLAAYTANEAASVQTPYLILAGVLFTIAVVFALLKLPAIRDSAAGAAEAQPERPLAQPHDSVWGYRHLVLGALGIFVYVGAEVSIGSFLVSLMEQPEIAGLTSEAAGKYLAIYWTGAMIGRFIGGVLMRWIRPGHMLAFNALMNAALIALAMGAGGKAAMWALIAIGLFNSIMFPTIFSLALEGLGKFTSEGSGVLCMAIVGGALVPLVQAFFADRIGLLYSFAVPLLCYLYIVYYGARGHNPDYGAAPAPAAAKR